MHYNSFNLYDIFKKTDNPKLDYLNKIVIIKLINIFV